MVKIKDFDMPSKCMKCLFETYDWDNAEHSCIISHMLTEDERETGRSENCPLVEEN